MPIVPFWPWREANLSPICGIRTDRTRTFTNFRPSWFVVSSTWSMYPASLARSGVLAAKIDYAGVLADDALWAAVVAFAAGTEPLDAAAHTQSLKKLRQERFPARRAPRSAVAGTTQHTQHNTRHANAPSTRHRRSAHHLDDASAFGTRVDGVGVGPLQPTPRTP